ncbi:MAG: hypothetical protein WC617_12180 [Rhodanobacter sp.]|jgi:hypothetical protein
MTSKALLLVAVVSVAALLVGCSGPLDTSLADTNQPEKASALLKVLSPDDQVALHYYVSEHTASGDIDWKMSVKDALKARKAELAREAQVKKNMDSIK